MVQHLLPLQTKNVAAEVSQSAQADNTAIVVLGNAWGVYQCVKIQLLQWQLLGAHIRVIPLLVPLETSFKAINVFVLDKLCWQALLTLVFVKQVTQVLSAGIVVSVRKRHACQTALILTSLPWLRSVPALRMANIV